MKAIRFAEYGAASVLRLEDVPAPTASDGELRVRVLAAGVNPMDWKVRAGYMQRMIPLALPVIPGSDFSGVADDGTEVYGKVDLPASGTYAEYVVVKRSAIAPKPRTIDHVHAAAVPLAGMTAMQGLQGLDLKSGQSLLIVGAAGGVGSFAIQLAVSRGVRVIAGVLPGQETYVKQLGADPVTELESAGQVDGVLDLIGGEAAARAWKSIKSGGAFASTLGPPSQAEASARTVRPVMVFTQTNGDQLALLGKLIDGGTIRVVVDHTFPLADAARAHDALQSGHIAGKIVLEI